jgi:hypothetical protein
MIVKEMVDKLRKAIENKNEMDIVIALNAIYEESFQKGFSKGYIYAKEN